MKKVLLLALMVALVAMGAFSVVSAQDEGMADITIWSQDGEDPDAVLLELFEMWAADSGLTVEIVPYDTEVLRNDLLTAGLAGEGLPDLVLGPNDAIGVFVDAGLVLPLDDLFDMEMYPYNIGAAQIAGVTYGIPTNAGNHLMFLYNKSLVMDAPETFEDLLAVAAEVEENNEGVQGFAYNLNEPFWFVGFAHGFGATMYDEEGNFSLDTDEWVAAYQFVHDLKFVDEAVPAECDYACANDLFKEGSVAMIINGDWSLGEYLDVEQSPALGPDNLGIAAWPALPNGEIPRPYAAGKFLSIPVTVEGDQLDAVVDFVTWLTTDEEAVAAYALGTNRLPAIEAVTVDADEDPALAASAKVLATSIGMPPNALLRCGWDGIRPNLEGVMSDSMSAEDAAYEAQLSAELCLEE